ncbi:MULTISPECIES: efflux RND transporter periplasmic adaptor subunit [unclassified Chelatococcus]|uniref:efflux RND transporter periplasmic adaptor subunit n=1 Tax=unclassified Chelatococcus TaxID=2638111 RepID=UPI001BCF869B|nr:MULTISPECIES: efflux RND transporter periplasmic adaptor subunit [unclassified Chelatococcus]MBS7742788.1 efflux RND transporter periplasmic adaptor subunit [Chelatococcus sp. HY11]MBX3542094.1 efflux RND transporter periplasmic adaptor subunit [Chelatococcus sp.]MCO5075690.1 efflux RND transporter periplasmic adaptor subunit [Chelatococcus sp.]
MIPTRSAMLVAALIVGLAAPAGTALRAQSPVSHVAPGPSVTVVEATVSEIVESVIVSGTMVARDEVLVMPEVDGLAIVDVFGEAGDQVFRGQVLARLSRTAFDVQKMQNEAQITRAEAVIAQARAQLAEAEANHRHASNSFERTKSLHDRGNATLELYDQRAAAARSTEARVNASSQALAIATADWTVAMAQRRDIDVKLARTDIKAPAAGIISRRNAKLGALASTAASEPLFRIFADAAVELEADVAEVELPRLAIDKPVTVTPSGSSSSLTGSIRLISPEVDRLSRLGRVRVSLAGIAPIAIGSFARGVIEIGRRKSVTLPLSAVVYGRNGPTVQHVADGRVSTRKIGVGLVEGSRVEILSGLVNGETVVARAGSFLRDGDIITPVATQ